ncbi:hypothetical protein CEXT_405731 [Caerostris extrusa]|uniref:Uncharacterized protein n=1 Tax=Caerostris extrusa TaxID=172846 RepID=A0AAV4UNE8_CAEEX|nr:hypothetical protein CEXT_405731 [Caerostris extrusa]
MKVVAKELPGVFQRHGVRRKNHVHLMGVRDPIYLKCVGSYKSNLCPNANSIMLCSMQRGSFKWNPANSSYIVAKLFNFLFLRTPPDGVSEATRMRV